MSLWSHHYIEKLISNVRNDSDGKADIHGGRKRHKLILRESVDVSNGFRIYWY